MSFKMAAMGCEDIDIMDNPDIDVRVPPEGMEEEKIMLSPSSHHLSVFQSEDQKFLNGKNLSDDLQGTIQEGGAEKLNYPCPYCNIQFKTQAELYVHCRSESHQITIMSDDGRHWRHRPPPRGYTSEQYRICQRFITYGTCRLNQQCCEAHSEEELAEWKERFVYRQMKIQRAKEKQLHGNLYSEQLLENWIQAAYPEKVMKESLDYVKMAVSSDLYATMSSKRSFRDWTFTLHSKAVLHHIALLNDAHRTHFYITSISSKSLDQGFDNTYEIENTCQEWTNPDYIRPIENMFMEYQVKIFFRTDIFGTFRQTVVFDFGSTPVLMQRLCVDVLPVEELDKLMEIRDTFFSNTVRWDPHNESIVPFQPSTNLLGEEDYSLLNYYTAPHSSRFVVTQSVMDKALTQENYAARLHDLLYIEELAQFEQVSRFNLTAKLQLIDRYMLAPSSNMTAKYSVSGELFARMKLNSEISEDTPAGRLVLTNCNTLLISYLNRDDEKGIPKKLYEASIEDKCKSFIYLKLSGQCVAELGLKPDEDIQAEVQFQLNRLPLCEMHYAVDKLTSTNAIFPSTMIPPNIPWNPQRQWADAFDSRLNPKQKEAIVAITTPLEIQMPPILIIGPFGTGKTFTLAQAIKQLVLKPDTRVLICTHSNSAADLYIKEYLHPYVLEGHSEARPLRIYYRNRWIQTVNPTVLQYCLVNNDNHSSSFRMPTMEDIAKYRIIVATLSTSRYLVHLGLDKGYFTHILVDEAAQAMECEAIMPLALADESTRVVLAGDHMQLSPEVYSSFAKERGLHTSLLERLYDLYPPTFPCRILLCENYRSHDVIIQYTSESFYDHQLVASGKQPRHEVFYPLTFFTARGEDVQDQNSTAFYNNSEVYEIVERVCELQKMWPKSWGKQDGNGIGIVSPYADQVFRIRTELRKRRMYDVSVERVLNVQGKQFRAVFLSTVRTMHTCSNQDEEEDDVEYGFLSNAKLLNTAIARARSLVAVVGDPISLCSIGKCRKLWERFIETCSEHKSLHGITWSSIRAQLDGVELKKSYVLNPLAPEFIPNRLRHGEPYIHFNAIVSPQGHLFFMPPAAWQNNPMLYPPNLYPGSLCPYPPSYLYGLRPPYLGSPMIIHPLRYPNWGLGHYGAPKVNSSFFPHHPHGPDSKLKNEKEQDKNEQMAQDAEKRNFKIVEEVSVEDTERGIRKKPFVKFQKERSQAKAKPNRFSYCCNRMPLQKQESNSAQQQFEDTSKDDNGALGRNRRRKDWHIREKDAILKHGKIFGSELGSLSKNVLAERQKATHRPITDTASQSKQFQFLPGVHYPETSSGNHFSSQKTSKVSANSEYAADPMKVNALPSKISPESEHRISSKLSRMKLEPEDTLQDCCCNTKEKNAVSDLERDKMAVNQPFNHNSLSFFRNSFPTDKILTHKDPPPFKQVNMTGNWLHNININQEGSRELENGCKSNRNISRIGNDSGISLFNSNATQKYEDIPNIPVAGLTVEEVEATLLSSYNNKYQELNPPPKSITNDMLSSALSQAKPNETVDVSWPPLPSQPPFELAQQNKVPLYLRCNNPSPPLALDGFCSKELLSQQSLNVIRPVFVTNNTEQHLYRNSQNYYVEHKHNKDSEIILHNSAMKNSECHFSVHKQSLDMEGSPQGFVACSNEPNVLNSESFDVNNQPLTYAGVLRAPPQKRIFSGMERFKSQEDDCSESKQVNLYRYFY